MHPALRLLTPWILISEVPSPCIFAPMERIYLQSHCISGSQAQFSNTVSPSASTAPKMPCWVAPTLLFEKRNQCPLQMRCFCHQNSLFLCDHCAKLPKHKKMHINRSFPDHAPTWIAKLPFPFLARSAPRRITEDRILPVNSKGTDHLPAFSQSIYRSWSSHQVTAPSF